MALFETKSVINDASMNELKWHLIAPSQKIMAVFGVLFSIYAAIILKSAIFCLFALPFIVLMPYRIKQNRKATINRLLESTNAKGCKITVSFGEDSLQCTNHSTNGTSTFSYDSIKKLVETKNYYALFTQANQYILVDKNHMEQMQKKEEFLGFIKSHCKNIRKKSKIPIIFGCLACVFAAVMYWEGGRTIFEHRMAPTEAEMQTVREIVSFEERKLSECKELLSQYDDKVRELGVEIRPVLRQTRAVNHNGRVENHSLHNEMWLPKYYSSQIICFVYKNGEMLEKQTSSSSTSYFAAAFDLVNARRDEDVVVYNEHPFYNSYTAFDVTINNLLERVSDFLQDDATWFAKF